MPDASSTSSSAIRAAVSCIDWSPRNLIAVTSSKTVSPKSRFKRRKVEHRTDDGPGIAILQSTPGGTRVPLCKLSAASEIHKGSQITLLRWDQTGQNLASVDDAGRIVVSGMQTCVNQWKVLHTVELGEPVVALQWVQTNRQWVVPVRPPGEVAEPRDDDQVPAFTRMHIIGPRAPTTNVAFMVVTASGHIRALYEDTAGELRQFGQSLDPPAESVLDDPESETPLARYRMSQVDVRLSADSKIYVAAYQHAPSPSLTVWKLEVNFFRKVITSLGHTRATPPFAPHLPTAESSPINIDVTHLRIVKDDVLLVVATNTSRASVTETGTAFVDTAYITNTVSTLTLTPSAEASTEYNWNTTATFDSSSGRVTAVDVLSRSEQRDCDPDPVILIGYETGRCELRDISSLFPANLNQFTFSRYVSLATVSVSSESAPATESEKATQEAAANGTNSAGSDEKADVADTKGDADAGKGETTVKMQNDLLIASQWTIEKRENAADGQPILSFAVSPNCVEILVAKRGAEGSTVVDLFKYDCDTLEATSQSIGRDAIVKCMATKFALAIMNGLEYTDLSFSSAQLATSILRTVYKYYDVMCAVTDDEPVGAPAPPAAPTIPTTSSTGGVNMPAVTTTTTFNPAPPTAAPFRLADAPLLSLQLAMHQSMPPRSQQPLVFITEAAIQIASVAGQCLASFEHHHVAMGRLETLVHTGNFQAMEANGLNSSMIIRKDCVQHVASLQTWFVRFAATVMRQAYCAFSVHRNTGKRRTAVKGDGEAAGGGGMVPAGAAASDEEERMRALAEVPSALSLVFHKPFRDAMIVVSLVMITLTQNLHIRAKFAKNGGHELLHAFYAQLLDSNRGAPLQFQALARFLFELGRELETVDVEHGDGGGGGNTVFAPVAGDIAAVVAEDIKPAPSSLPTPPPSPSRAAREREMLLTGRVAAGGPPGWGYKAATRAKLIFEGHVRHVFEIRGPNRAAAAGVGGAPQPQQLSASGADDLLDLRLAPAIRLLFGFASVQAVGLTAPHPAAVKNSSASGSRSNKLAPPGIDIVSKRPLETAVVVAAGMRRRGEDASVAAAPPEGGRSDPLADYKTIERGAQAWAKRMFKGNCVCGGWWKEVENTTAPP
ncbi:hypothetical protein HDU87_001647 [Geranomyces variabilis]|uniref:Mediator of RNA polymerase II transcription subunit 16 n=1 Tax=Geranomyces variabilis TaxID=109894 RepID=A0AAD5XTV4_9FUNG|nr:hypothetical protein HDU87_001647 [Geranomyces variabilis]